MNNIYRKFFQKFYSQTNGFMPTKPLNQIVYPGDFFQIKNGKMNFLGNLFSSNILDTKNVVFKHGIKLNAESWDFSQGVTKPYSGRGTGNSPIDGAFEFSKQILAFDSPGSFLFKSSNPEAVKIANWSDLQSELIIKLTQNNFSFRELYVVTETASAAHWSLVISSSNKGELEIATETENHSLVDIFGDLQLKTVQSKDIEYYHRESERKPSFFKAQKLITQNEKLETFIEELIYQRTMQNKWASDFYEYQPHKNNSDYGPAVSKNEETNILDMLPGNQLNPNTALLYFKWANTSLDDIEKLFLSYGI
jgi:hypothetical protein